MGPGLVLALYLAVAEDPGMDMLAAAVQYPLCGVMSERATEARAASFEVVERRLFDACAIKVTSRRVRLADPPLTVRVLEAGDGPPLVLVHGSGMSASTWAPLLPYLAGYGLIVFDLPGFGLSDAFDYTGRSLRGHAVAQLRSLLDALDLERVGVIGTSLGGMWALCLAVDAPERITALASLGVPAVALPGMRGDPAFTALSTPGVRQVLARIGSPSVAVTRRSLARGAIGRRAAELAPVGFFDVVHEGMRQPGFRTAMLSHMWLAMRLGRPRAENFLSDAELQHIPVPVLMVWGDEDPYGGPEIGRRAAALIPNAHLEVIPGRHAPFLDDPQRCGALIDELLRGAAAPPNGSRSDEETRRGPE
jgi:pimeloyl-ACP methyl ester carboxylesterase